MGLTAQLAEFVSTLEYERIPAAAIETVKRGAIDCVGVMLAGREETVVGIVRDTVRSHAKHGEARLLFGDERADAGDAALVNATAAHALDYDDTGLDGHPSVVLVPAILAEGERVAANGTELITAYVAGYETWAELVAREADKLHGKGWHPTPVFGTIAAAAAAARLARLDAERTACALGIAGSMSAGLVANFGSMTKPFQVGRAVQNGLLAARLAASGLSASPDALEHPGGFLAAVSPRGRVRLDGDIAGGLGWKIVSEGLNVKRYPVCYALHRAIDAMLGFAGAEKLEAEGIAQIEVSVGAMQAKMLRHHRPQNALDAKFSAEFAMACCVVAGKVGLAELQDGFVRTEAVQKLMPKVRIHVMDEVDPEEPLFSPYDAVRIGLRDGRTLESPRVRHALGHARNPLGLEGLRSKFVDCAGASAGMALFEKLRGLERLASVAELYEPYAA